MYLKKSLIKKSGRTHLSIKESFRDKDGIPRQKTVKTLGYLDVLEKEYDDPIAHFTEVAKQMTEKYKKETAPVVLEINKNAILPENSCSRKNYGYAAFSKIYHELEIDQFFKNRQRKSKAQFNINSIFRALVFSRLLNPCSKRASFDSFGRLFDKCDFTLDDVYRSLDIFKSYQSDLQLWIHEHIKKQYSRDTSLVYYDVTNYYFEIDEEDDMRRRGVSKEHRPDPIVQMGLFMDTNGLPINYGLFSGNTLDKQTLIPMMGRLVDDYNLGKVIVVADRGMITGDNIAQTIIDGNGYVLSYSIKSADKEFKDYVFDPSGYSVPSEEDGFRIKSRQADRLIWVTEPFTGKKKHISVEEKHVVFYSPDYAKKARCERERVLIKAKSLIANPGKYNKSTGYGAAKYIKNIAFDKTTGEILTAKGQVLEIDDVLIKEEEKYDGYYAIVTSEYEKTDSEILDIYRGLWKIEESFKITKTGLETRPVYLSNHEHIQAHFLICFTALILARLLEYRIERKYPVQRILESIRNSECALMEENMYLFDYRDEVLDEIGKAMGIDFSRKYMTLKEIKTVMSDVKKPAPLK